MQHDLTPVPGSDLRQRRIDAGVELIDLANALHCSRTTVWRTETSERVSYIRSRRYMDALHEVVASHAKAAAS